MKTNIKCLRYSWIAVLCVSVATTLLPTWSAYALDIDTDTTITSSIAEDIFIGGVNHDPFTVVTSPGVSLGNPGTTSVLNHANFELNGGSVSDLVLRDDATAFLNEGTVQYLSPVDRSLLNIGGTIDTVTVKYLPTGNSSVTNILSGQVGRITAAATSTINIYGGLVGVPQNGIRLIGAFDRSTINFFGTNFSLDSAAPGNYGSYSGDFYHVTGTLSDGTDLDTRLFIASGGPGIVDPHVNFGSVVVPEASTLRYLLMMILIIVFSFSGRMAFSKSAKVRSLS